MVSFAYVGHVEASLPNRNHNQLKVPCGKFKKTQKKKKKKSNYT